MAYSDIAPRDVEAKLKRLAKPKRRSRCPTQEEIWGDWRIKPKMKKRQKRHSLGKWMVKRAQRASEILLAAFAAAGDAIAAGLLDETPRRREPTLAEKLLAQIDQSKAIRQVVGRVDVSGASNGAAWATTRDDGKGGTVLEVFYRHGREVLADLAKVVDSFVRGLGWKIGRSFDRIRQAPKLASGVWLATFTLAPPHESSGAVC